ncbi:hypothetical protein D5085_01505 [Ectothiorhodospiraceae bacterium BW-2]|nr:hypothetical protein D5085_01505 [Ectothiorhodospiraceae bacterium BW-2]
MKHDLTLQNETKEYLTAYFNGHIAYNSDMLEAMRHDIYRNIAKFDFYEQYLIAGNPRILHLILEGLAARPDSPLLLELLLFFHQFHPILPQLIGCYTQAFLQNNDDEDLFEMALDFIEATAENGYDAMAQLRVLFANNTNKLQLLDEVELQIQQSRETAWF